MSQCFSLQNFSSLYFLRSFCLSSVFQNDIINNGATIYTAPTLKAVIDIKKLLDDHDSTTSWASHKKSPYLRGLDKVKKSF